VNHWEGARRVTGERSSRLDGLRGLPSNPYLTKKTQTYAIHFDLIAVAAVMVLGGIYAGSLLRIGWIPGDEGTLAQSALRVYRGELPHRDFSEAYTGGLSFLHALAFRGFGVNLFSLRIMSFLFFLAWLPALYYAARRFVNAPGAALVALTAVSWSYPNYVAAMPSWYNLFFATFGAAALLRYLEVRTSRWLFVAGVCGGASVLVKVTGLYYVAAVLLFLLFVEQSNGTPADPAAVDRRGRSGRGYRLVCGLGLGLYLAGITCMIWPEFHPGEAYEFLLPSVACVAILLAWERQGSASSETRFRSLAALTAPFLLGIAGIFGAFLMPYAASGSVRAMLHDLVASTQSRMVGLAGKEHAPTLFQVGRHGLAPMAILVFAMYGRWSRYRIVAAAIACMLGWTVFDSMQIIRMQSMYTWMMAGTLTPLVVLLGATLILGGPRCGADSALARQRLMLTISLAGVCTLIQYPVPYVTYFCYTAPLALLAAVACIGARRNPPGKLMLNILLLFYLAFGVFVMVPRHVFNPDLETGAVHAMSDARFGALRIDSTTPHYEELIPFLQAHSANGMMYAGRDCPELYFLTGLKNATRDDTGAPDAEVIAAVQAGSLRLVVLQDRTLYTSQAVSPALRAEIANALPNRRQIGRFSIYWR
jgi:hypothetical protein